MDAFRPHVLTIQEEEFHLIYSCGVAPLTSFESYGSVKCVGTMFPYFVESIADLDRAQGLLLRGAGKEKSGLELQTHFAGIIEPTELQYAFTQVCLRASDPVRARTFFDQLVSSFPFYPGPYDESIVTDDIFLARGLYRLIAATEGQFQALRDNSN